MLKPSLHNKIKTRLVRCKGAHENQNQVRWEKVKKEGKRKKKKENQNTSSGCGVTASLQYYDVSKWGACLLTRVPVQISIAPVAATLTAVESH